MMRFSTFPSLAFLLLFCGNVSATQQAPQNPADKPADKAKEEKKTPPPPEEKSVTSKHSLKIGGQEIKYTATAGTILFMSASTAAGKGK